MKIKTIDVNAKEWFDRTYGNSYFSANITINYGMANETSFFIPMQYGYGDHYKDIALKELIKRRFIKGIDSDKVALWIYCQDHNIILRYSKQENCLKRELKY